MLLLCTFETAALESSLETEFEELSRATKTRFIAIQPILCTLVIITKNRPQQPNSTHTMQNANMTCVAYCLIEVLISCLIFMIYNPTQKFTHSTK